MAIIQTAERSSHLDPSENVIFQRHMVAYKEAAKIISGTVLEIGSGEGYGIKELAPISDQFIAIDKYDTHIADKLRDNNKIKFIKTEVPPLIQIQSNSIDFVVTFQVIEHINDDELFLNEINRVLKPGGKLILTTPNKLMSLTRSPWHVREYTPEQMQSLISKIFSLADVKGVFGNSKVMDYYKKNKESVGRITKWDIFNMQYWLPKRLLQIPYDILNRLNRRKLRDNNTALVNHVKYTDYSIDFSSNKCLDHFIIATK